MSVKAKLSHPLVALVILLVVSMIALLTTFIILRMKDKPVQFLAAEAQKSPEPFTEPTEILKTTTAENFNRKSSQRTLVLSSTPQTSTSPPAAPVNVCESPACVTLSHKLLNYRDTSVDVCQDFHKAVCGKYYEHSLSNGQMNEKRKILTRIIREFLIRNEPSTSKSENTMKLLFSKCQELDDLDIEDDRDDVNQEVFDDIKRIGSWPLTVKNWDESKFNLNDMLSSMGRLGITDFGFMRFAQFRHDLQITPSAKEPINTGKIEEIILKFLEDNDIDDVDSTSISKDIKEILDLENKLRSIIDTKPLHYTEYLKLKSNVPSIDFDRILQNFINPKKKDKLWPILENRTVTYQFELFFGQRENLETILKTTPLRTIANYLFVQYLETSLGKFIFEGKIECDEVVIKYLAHASLRVFVRNHFDKENLKIVSEMIEDKKKIFIEIIKDSTWLREDTKKNAISKVKKMKKVVGYPKEFDAPGALDKLFENLDVSPSDSFTTLVKKIGVFNWELIIEFITFETRLDPQVELFGVNAFYTYISNKIAVLAPVIDEPLFDSTYPEYAKIATIGFVLGHEIGHGFGVEGREHDENGNRKNRWNPEDLREHDKRIQCLVNQYNEYEDPDFGKNLNGTRVVEELIADNFGAEVAWRAIKKLNQSEQSSLIGFKDYNFEKLYFHVLAVTRCNQRDSNELEKVVRRKTHPTDSFRTNGVFSNMKSFAETFNCPVGSPMNPVKKCELF